MANASGTGNGIGNYVDELHQLFPNGFHETNGPEVGVLIDIFDNVGISGASKVDGEDGAQSLLDDILSRIDPSLATKKAIGSETVTDVQSAILQQADTVQTSYDSSSRPGNTPVYEMSNAKTPVESTSTSTSISTTSPRSLRDLAGKAVARKYDVYTGEDRSSIVPNPVLVPKATPSPQRAMHVASSAVPFPTTTASSAAPTPSPSRKVSVGNGTPQSTSPQRFMSIAGRSARDQAQALAEADKFASSSPSPSPSPNRLLTGSSNAQPSNAAVNGRRSVFNQVNIRNSSSQGPQGILSHSHTRRRGPAPASSDRSSSEEGSPPMQRHGSREPPSIHRHRSFNASRDPRYAARHEQRPDFQPRHQWTPDPTPLERTSPKTLRYTQGAYREREEAPPRTEPEFTGYKNGWKPMANPVVLDVRGGRTLNESNAAEAERLNAGVDDGPDPFHWTGSSQEQGGRTDLIGKGALGSRAGGYQSRSDERFAAATAALHAGRVPSAGGDAVSDMTAARNQVDPNMDPFKASWEMQRRTISGPMNSRNRQLAQTKVA